MALRTLQCLVALLVPLLASAGSMTNTRILLRGNSWNVEDDRSQSCSDLINKGTHFVAPVSVGTPPQTFQLVADTGSDALVVTSCVCVKQGYCPAQKKCFTGTNHSQSFKVTTADGPHHQQAGVGVRMTFGSGTVSAIVASDIAQIAGVKARMDDGLLLLLDRRELKINGEFEGILGLGPLLGKAANGQSTLPKPSMPNWKVPRPMGFSPKLFLQEAKVDRFSICFNDGAKPGALRLNMPKFKHPIPAIGTQHWGVGLYGLSVGAGSAESIFCDSAGMNKSQQTPCGAIPDSGTTLIMGPAKQVTGLFDHLCENWERCRNARQGDMKNLTGSHAFQTLLYQCGSWLTGKNSINELPSVFLTVGSPGRLQKLEITPWAYVVETQQAEYKQSVKHLFGVIPVVVGEPTGKQMKVCVPSFGVQEYNTATNGPVWIMGTPLFYQFQVGFDLSGTSVAFTKEKCGLCNGTASFLTSHQELHPERLERSRPMRVVHGSPRVRSFDTSLPL